MYVISLPDIYPVSHNSAHSLQSAQIFCFHKTNIGVSLFFSLNAARYLIIPCKTINKFSHDLPRNFQAWLQPVFAHSSITKARNRTAISALLFNRTHQYRLNLRTIYTHYLISIPDESFAVKTVPCNNTPVSLTQDSLLPQSHLLRVYNTRSLMRVLIVARYSL